MGMPKKLGSNGGYKVTVLYWFAAAKGQTLSSPGRGCQGGLSWQLQAGNPNSRGKLLLASGQASKKK